MEDSRVATPDPALTTGGEEPPPIPAETPASRPLRLTPKRPSSPPPPVRYSRTKLKTSLDMVTSHWCQPIIGLQVTPSQFYEAVIRAVQERRIPGVEFSRVWWKASAFTGANREYLRVTRSRFVYDICAAPYGAGSFISSWLCIVPFTLSLWHLAGMIGAAMFLFWLPPVAIYYAFCLLVTGGAWWMYCRTVTATSIKDDLILGLTGIGPILKMRAESKPTYFQIDAAAVFQTAVQEAVMAVVDKLCQEQNLRPLAELERKPVAREFLKK